MLTIKDRSPPGSLKLKERYYYLRYTVRTPTTNTTVTGLHGCLDTILKTTKRGPTMKNSTVFLRALNVIQ